MDWFVLLTFVVVLLASILSGLSGGGGGFITMPYYLLIGLPPANAIATSKMGSIGTVFGSLTALRGKGLVHKKLAYKLMAITLACAIVAAWLIPKIDPILFQKTIAVFLILLIPTLFINKPAFQPGARSSRWIVAGFILYTVVSFLQTLIGTGMGSLVVLVLMFMFGLGALEANATKRVAQAVQAILLFVLLGIQGLIFWWHGLAAILGGAIGSNIGTRIAIKKGSQFVKIMLAILMFVSGIALLM